MRNSCLYQFTLGLSLVFVFSHGLLNYFGENSVLAFFAVFLKLK